MAQSHYGKIEFISLSCILFSGITAMSGVNNDEKPD
jgi:hypothetical protein